MKLQLLPSTIDEDGSASQRQHLLSIVIDDRVAIDAGSLAFSCSDLQRSQIRDIVLTHAHLDHVASLPMFIDDLFSSLTEPIRIHGTSEVIEILERDVFNWSIYPRFSELTNEHGPVMEYRQFVRGGGFEAAHLTVRSVPVNHQVAASGYIITDQESAVAITGDTAETDDFWAACNQTENLRAVLVECAFPDEMAELACVSNHLTPGKLRSEIEKIANRDLPVYIIDIKPMYREIVMKQIADLQLSTVEILTVGAVYNF